MASTISYNSIKECLAKSNIFAAYSLAGEKKFKLIASHSEKCSKLNSFSDLDSIKGFVFVPFSDSHNLPIIIDPDLFLNEGDPDHDLKKIKPLSNFPIPEDQANTSKAVYFNHFNQMMKALKKGDFSKLVLSRILSIARDEKSLVDVFRLLNQAYPYNFNYIINTPEGGCWIGSSPEILYEENEKHAKTIALAGTQKNANKHVEDYVWGIKEQKEQAFVVDYIEKTLSNHLNHNYKKIKSTAIAANVAHLRTTFTFNKDRLISLGAFIKDLHPTPAVCGLPKNKAHSFIQKTENHNREYYSGFLGPLNIDSQSNLFVNLRCLKVGKTQFHLFVGGGITKDSEAQKEWEETELKAETLLSIINKT